MNEADTCRTLITPALQTAGWDRDPCRINEQVTFTDGRIVVAGQAHDKHDLGHILYRKRLAPPLYSLLFLFPNGGLA